MQKIWGMRSTPLFPWLPIPIWSGVVVPDNILFMSQIELNRSFECLLMLHLNSQFMQNWLV